MSEFLIIMEQGATTEQTDRVIKAVRSDQGKVQQRYPPRIIIGRDGEDIKKRLSKPKLEGVSAVYLSDKDPEELGLDKVGSLGLGKEGSSAVRAWIVRNSKEYRERKAARRFKELRLPDHDAIPGGVDALGATPTMTGTASVGIIFVEGPPGTTAEFTSDEEDTVNREVQYATWQLKSLAPPSTDLNFVLNPQIVTLSASPNTVSGERDWRDMAMVQLGYAKGDPGLDAYVNYLKTTNGSDWAYIAFFTKYKAYGTMFSYHPRGASYCVIRYPQPGNDGRYADYGGYQPDELDFMFAHETGHICGAQHNCGPGEDVTCLMSQNSGWQVCPNTAALFGW